ncbi:MAG TPA: TraR/DksA C4-type zinc finger protein [Haliangium sp.]|nr:TraR/DksA C4-type zinc finger protein [Haliangium sp.]
MRPRPQRDAMRQPGASEIGSEQSELPLSEARNLLEKRREQLVSLRASHQQQRDDLLDQRPLDTGDASVRDDFVDRQDRFEERELRALQAIDAALARIESGEYGICRGCEEPIDGDRLRAIPETALCVACAEPSATSQEFDRLANQSLKL